jgi:2-hydroxychromene-2-carboxylate isomerase
MRSFRLLLTRIGLRVGAERQDGEAVLLAGMDVLEDLEGGALGDVERRVLRALVGHAVGLIDHEEVMGVAVAEGLDGGLAEEGPGDGQGRGGP